MDDLIAFLKARLAEREAKALGAGEIGTPDWHVGEDGSGNPESDACVIDGNGEIVVYDEGRPRLAEAVHIADNDPAWALADIESKRQVIKLYENAVSAKRAGSISYRNRTQDEAAVDVLGAAVQSLALPYAGRPDYLEEWKP